ncbi:hypothetical protein ACFZAU_15040 [Streptomyces sp. NPDC008238]
MNSKTKYTLAIAAAGWTFLASQWSGKGCDFVPQSYALVISHGMPANGEGCKAQSDGPQYTDQYSK